MTTASTLRPTLRVLLLAAAIWPWLSFAQVPVDDDGQPIAEDHAAPATGDEDIPLLSRTELEELVGPIALYPDDLLAVVLPASAYPLQIVQAGRFLDDLEDDPSLEPDPAWDDSVVALTNYPEVVALLNEDLDWTWRLGEAVVAQQADVIAAIETFRDRAYAAGNLKSDAHQSVSHNDGVIEISPVSEDTIYVPYYEPEHVVVYQPRPVYFYYPRPRPVYYYPYSPGYAFHHGFFWGVTTAFTIGWYTDHLHVFHHSYHGHPYYGRVYRDHWWYRRPSFDVHNHYYPTSTINISINRYRSGDYWRPQKRRTVRSSDHRVTRSGYYPGRDIRRTRASTTVDARREHDTQARNRRSVRQSTSAVETGVRPQRNSGVAVRSRRTDRTPETVTSSSLRRDRAHKNPEAIRFRERPSRSGTERPARRSGTEPAGDTRRETGHAPRQQHTPRSARNLRSNNRGGVTTTTHTAPRMPGIAQSLRSEPTATRPPKRRTHTAPPKVSAPRQMAPRTAHPSAEARRVPERQVRQHATAPQRPGRDSAKPSKQRGKKAEAKPDRPRTRLAAEARQR